MWKYISLGILAIIVCFIGAFTSRNDEFKYKKYLWWFGFILSLCLTGLTVWDSVKSEKYTQLKTRISKLEFDAISGLNSRVAFMELISIQDSIQNSGNNKNQSLNSEVEQAYRKVYEFYWKFRHNENAFAYELKFHLQKEQRRLTTIIWTKH